MHARVATFQGNPADADAMVAGVKREVEAGNVPEGLEGSKLLMLVDRSSGKALGISLFESEEAMRRGDEALNAMNPEGGQSRTSVEFFEVPVATLD